MGQVATDVPREFAQVALSMEKGWRVLSHIFSTNVDFALSQMPLQLLENDTRILFITADQPAINLKASYNNFDPPTELELYYSVSPKVAIIISEKNKCSFPRTLSKEDVTKLNDMAAKASLEQIYASEPGALEKYRDVTCNG